MHNFVRSENCAMKQIKLSNCTRYILVLSGSNSIQSDKMLQNFKLNNFWLGYLAILIILDRKHGRSEGEHGEQMLPLDFVDISQNTNILSQYNTIQYNTIQYNTIQYNTIQYNTIQYNTIQYNTVQYNTIQYNTTGI